MSRFDWDYLIQKDRVHRSVYTDEKIFRLEMEKLFGGVWTYLCHASEIPNENDFKTVTVGFRPLIVTRDKNGDVHAIVNRCSHRGAVICKAKSGSSTRFTCPYHGWTFRNDGKIMGPSFPKLYENTFDRDAHNLSKAPRVESYRGFIFATFNEEIVSLVDYLGPAATYIDHWVDRAPEKEIIVDAGAYRGLYHGNWKLAWDNAADGYHVNFAHRSLVEMTAIRNGAGQGASYMGSDPDDSPMYVKQFPNGHTLLHHRPGMGPSIWRQARPMPGREFYEDKIKRKLGEEAGASALELAPGYGVNLNIFPNLLLLANQIQVVEPIAIDKTALIWHATRLKGADDDINLLRMRIGEDFPNFGEVDDLEMFELCWRGLQTSEIEWINTSRRAPEEQVDEAGVLTATATDEAPLRGFLHAYREFMKRDSVNAVA